MEEEFIPDFETCVKQVAVHMRARGKTYMEIAIDPETNEIATTFLPTRPRPEDMYSKN